MTGDDHASTAARRPGSTSYAGASPAGCSVAHWECVRGTSYIYPNTPLTDAQAPSYVAQGFEIGAAPQHGLRRLHAGVARRASTPIS